VVVVDFATSIPWTATGKARRLLKIQTKEVAERSSTVQNATNLRNAAKEEILPRITDATKELLPEEW
jgi:hypothetical protein